jgi:two-component system NtrC family sensor kinase
MEALGQLVSGVAHELNNPLSAIIAFSQLIRRDPSLPPELGHDAELLMQEADRTRRIVQNLLDFARQRPPARQPTSVRALVDRTAELHAYGLGTANIRLELAIPEDTPPIDVDPSQLQQVVLNLTMNAIQAIAGEGRPGRIEVSARTIEHDGVRHVEVRFTDDGPGVAPEARDRLFEPFYTTKPVGEGTGLGLSVSYGIVTSHGGRLWYEPAANGGSTFVIALPAAGVSFRERSVEPVVPAPGQRRGGVVLVVDDESSIRAFLSRALSKAGHEVTLAADGGEALAALERLSFDAILCDHRMTTLDGLQVYERGVAARPELQGRFVLMSGDVLNPALQAFAEQHRIELLAKPFDIDTVLDAVDAVIDRGEAES